MASNIQIVNNPDKVIFLFGRTPGIDWSKYPFTVFKGWKQDGKDYILRNRKADLLVLTDNLSASGVVALKDRFGFETRTYDDFIKNPGVKNLTPDEVDNQYRLFLTNDDRVPFDISNIESFKFKKMDNYGYGFSFWLKNKIYELVKNSSSKQEVLKKLNANDAFLCDFVDYTGDLDNRIMFNTKDPFGNKKLLIMVKD